jgi:hypothetical protein
MAHVDVIANAIDWLDACKSNDWQSVVELYAPEAGLSVPGAQFRSSETFLTGLEEIKAYWIETFSRDARAIFELVELYPGHDSAILIYYDEKCQRVSEFLQFDEAGLIKLSARHLIPIRRQALPLAAAPNLYDKQNSENEVLRCEARQSLGEARRLPIGSARNALRQRAVALRALAQRSTTASG